MPVNMLLFNLTFVLIHTNFNENRYMHVTNTWSLVIKINFNNMVNKLRSFYGEWIVSVWFTANLGGLTGGWVPATMDTNQYIEVNLTEPTFVHWVQIQGQDSVDSWVTSFSVLYSSDGVTWATYINSSGASVSQI